MTSTSKGLSVVLTFLVLAASAYAQSPREQLQQMVEQLRANQNDHLLRGRIIKQAQEITPAPAIPEEAREPFVMGITVLRKASDPAGASKAVDLFTQALTVAPWFADAYYNRAMAREIAAQLEPAIDDLKLYQTNQTDRTDQTSKTVGELLQQPTVMPVRLLGDIPARS
jgi:hypothetical protein